MNTSTIDNICFLVNSLGRLVGELTEDDITAARNGSPVRERISVPGCYILLNNLNGRAKIGRSGNMFTRWRNLETQGGEEIPSSDIKLLTVVYS